MQTTASGLINRVVRAADAPMFAVVGTLLQFVSTPDQNGGNLSVMRAGIPPKAVVPLHSHADPEIFYRQKERWKSSRMTEHLQGGKRPTPVTL